MIFTFIKNYFLLFLFLSFAILFTGCGEQTQDNKVLTVGLSSGYPPYEILNQTGELEGFDIDIAHAISAKLGKKVIIKDMVFDVLIMALNQGKLDVIISGMSITEQRLEKLHMIHYQGKHLTHLSMIFWNNIPDGIRSLDDLTKYPDGVVCVQPGTIQDEVMKLHPAVTIKYLDVPQMPMDLMYGKSFAALLENPVADSIKEKQPNIKIVRVELPPQKHTLGNGIAINKKNTPLATQIEQIIAEFKADGTIANLEKKWFKKEAADV